MGKIQNSHNVENNMNGTKARDCEDQEKNDFFLPSCP